jgi:hypothetical protein
MMKKMILDPFFHCTFRVTAGQKGLMNFAQKRCRGKPSQKGPNPDKSGKRQAGAS